MLKIKKFFVFYLLTCLIYLSFTQVSFAFDASKVIVYAEKINPQSLMGEVDKKVLKKYIPVRLTVKNNSEDQIQLSKNVYYINEYGEKHLIPSSAIIFEETKRHTVRRAILSSISLFVFVIGGVAAYSITQNAKLEDNIKKYNFKPQHLFENDTYSTYIFIPKKHKNAKEIVVKNILINDEKSFDLQTPISDEYFN